MSRSMSLVAYNIVRDLFWASVATCFLWAMHRLAAGSLLRGRAEAYLAVRDHYTPEELEELIHVIKHDSIAY